MEKELNRQPYTLSINGKNYYSDHDKKLLRFLRDDLHLTATKDGCSEGACGTCMVWLMALRQKHA